MAPAAQLGMRLAREGEGRRDLGLREGWLVGEAAWRSWASVDWKGES